MAEEVETVEMVGLVGLVVVVMVGPRPVYWYEPDGCDDTARFIAITAMMVMMWHECDGCDSDATLAQCRWVTNHP